MWEAREERLHEGGCHREMGIELGLVNEHIVQHEVWGLCACTTRDGQEECFSV